MDQLQSRIHETFAMVRDSVVAELHTKPAEPVPQAYQTPRNQAPAADVPASLTDQPSVIARLKV